MNNENVLDISTIIDPAAIARTGTYVIDLTQATQSDTAVPDVF